MIRTIFIEKRQYWLAPIHYEGVLLGYTVFNEELDEVPTKEERLDDPSLVGWVHFDGCWGGMDWDHVDDVAAVCERIRKKSWAK